MTHFDSQIGDDDVRIRTINAVLSKVSCVNYFSTLFVVISKELTDASVMPCWSARRPLRSMY